MKPTAALALLAAITAQAALVAVDQVFYFDLAACPANFAGLDPASLGQLFVGAISSNAGYANGKTAFTNGAGPTHGHAGTTSMSVTLAGTSTASDAWFSWTNDGNALNARTASLSGMGTVSEAGSSFPHVQLLACKVTNANGMQVPLGAIAMLDPKTSVPTGNPTVCSSGFDDFALGQGRFLVATSTAQPSPNFATANPTAAYTAATPDIATHTHTLTSSFSLPNRGCGTGSTTRGKSGSYTISGASSASSVNLALRAVRQCKANTDIAASSSPQLPLGALAFFAAASCPMLNWVPADSKYNGRLIVSLPSGASNGQTFGNPTLLTSGAAGSAHSHNSWTGGVIIFGDTSWTSETDSSGCVAENGAGFGVGTGTVTSDTVAIPTVTVLLCRRTDPTPSPTMPTQQPTLAPTQQPTLAPTKEPTKAPTTLQPTLQPTLAPTKEPTKTPTTLHPTTSPTTSEPTLSPTTSEPTTSPTTSTPSAGPTSSPTLQPTSQPSESPTESPTTSTPSAGPTSSPTLRPTFHPSVSPTESPTTSTPSAGPTSSPTLRPTFQPSVSPTDSPTKEPTTFQPSVSPTESPTTSLPSAGPTLSPTKTPTTGAPTQKPSRSPTGTRSPTTPTVESPTLRPSTSPSTAPTTSEPTTSPTTSKPTVSPSASPSASPTVSPTTSKPTLSPTTSAPTLSPTTSKPTASPTTLAPTLRPSTSPSTAPTTSEPTASPSTSKPTLSPSTSPSAAPTTSAPTVSPTTSAPTTSPTTSAPTVSPTTSAPTTSAPTTPPTTSAPTTSAPTTPPTEAPAASIEEQAAAEAAATTATAVGAVVGVLAALLLGVLLIRRMGKNRRAAREPSAKNKDVFAMTTAGRVPENGSGNPVFYQEGTQV